MELSGTLENSKFSKKGYSRFPALATTFGDGDGDGSENGYVKKAIGFFKQKQ